MSLSAGSFPWDLSSLILSSLKILYSFFLIFLLFGWWTSIFWFSYSLFSFLLFCSIFPGHILNFIKHCSAQFSSVQSLSWIRLFATPWTAANQAPLSITNSRSLLKLMSIELVMPSNHLILCRPLLLPPSIFPSIRVFSNELALPIRWPKYWSFRFRISTSNEYSGLISFRKDWLDLLAVQGTLKSLLQYPSWKASVLQRSAFFIVQLSMTTGKTTALTRQIFGGNVMSLLFNMLSRLVTAFLPRSKHLLISWLQSPSAMILEPKKISLVLGYPFILKFEYSKVNCKSGASR